MSMIADIHTDSQVSPICFKSWLQHPTLLVDPRERIFLQQKLEENLTMRICFTVAKGNSVRNSLPRKHLRPPANFAADGKNLHVSEGHFQILKSQVYDSPPARVISRS